MGGFWVVFEELEDPRAANARHDLTEVLFIALAAILCGAESCSDMADFGRSKRSLLEECLKLEHGIPSHDTFSRVFRLLDPKGFEAVFRRFMAAFAKSITGVVAIDGKSVRRAFERGRRTTPLHLVNVWAVDARLALGQRKAPNRNEVAGTLEILRLLSLEGCLVTADALHCHKAMAEGIRERGGEFVIALKENQGALYVDAVAAIEAAPSSDTAAQEPAISHGRLEARRATVVADASLAERHDFPAIAAVAKVESERQVQGKENKSNARYFVLSRCFPAEKLLDIVRQHWTIENSLHWVLDVVFDEDGARNRKDNGPENLALLRKLALNILRSHPDKASIRRKIKKAGWDDAFLLSLFGHMR